MPTDISLTERTRETYNTLLDAARSMFEEEGYASTSINQIVARAGVARGTFYIYFESKEDILQTIAEQIERDIQVMQVGIDELPDHEFERAHALIRDSTVRFLRFYRENSRMMAVLENVATHDYDFRQLRLRMRRTAAVRAIGLIDRLKQTGEVSQHLDSRYAAVALTGMVDRFAFVWFNLDEDFEESTAVDVLSRLWLQAIAAAPAPDDH